ncbi:MAG TPA: GFA family protein [Burkholderiales bacterium]|nr:GFA family protein [Burkholderiales bacterium]
MATDAVCGSCLCGSVKFEVTPPFAAFRYCHCSRCQKASGSAHAANAFVPEQQFRWIAGESTVKRFDLPGAKRFAVSFCQTCGTRVPHKVGGTQNMLVPAGLLEADPGTRPDNSIFWASKAAWYVSPDAHPRFDTYG